MAHTPERANAVAGASLQVLTLMRFIAWRTASNVALQACRRSTWRSARAQARIHDSGVHLGGCSGSSHLTCNPHQTEGCRSHPLSSYDPATGPSCMHQMAGAASYAQALVPTWYSHMRSNIVHASDTLVAIRSAGKSFQVTDTGQCALFTSAMSFSRAGDSNCWGINR